jgi:hypothetical protein
MVSLDSSEKLLPTVRTFSTIRVQRMTLFEKEEFTAKGAHSNFSQPEFSASNRRSDHAAGYGCECLSVEAVALSFYLYLLNIF